MIYFGRGRADASRADLVITSLSSDEAVEAVYGDLFAGQEVGPSESFTRNLANLSLQGQEDSGDGIVPGGRGRTTIFVDTSTVGPVPLSTKRALR